MTRLLYCRTVKSLKSVMKAQHKKIIVIQVEIYDALDLCAISFQLLDVCSFRERQSIPLYPGHFT